MSTILMQHEYNEKMRTVAENFRTGKFAEVLRFLLEEAGVPLCAHGFWEHGAASECPLCRAEIDRAMEGGL
jgi:hypothetical protein